MASIEEHDGYDDTLPTPDMVVQDEPDPNPPSGNLPDAPPSGYQFADGAVDPDTGHMLNAEGERIEPKPYESALPLGGE